MCASELPREKKKRKEKKVDVLLRPRFLTQKLGMVLKFRRMIVLLCIAIQNELM